MVWLDLLYWIFIAGMLLWFIIFPCWLKLSGYINLKSGIRLLSDIYTNEEGIPTLDARKMNLSEAKSYTTDFIWKQSMESQDVCKILTGRSRISKDEVVTLKANIFIFLSKLEAVDSVVEDDTSLLVHVLPFSQIKPGNIISNFYQQFS